MKHEIIKTDNYLVVVSDGEIKENDFGLSKLNEVVLFGKKYTQSLYKKIIAHLPLNNSPILEDVDLLPPLADDIDELASNWIDENSHKWSNNNDEVGDNYGSFKEGYNKAKATYKYTEEDILGAIEIGFELGRNFDDDSPNIGLAWLVNQKDYFIQSLQQPQLPIAFECEYKPTLPYKYTTEEHLDVEPKTTTNSEGRTEWVGTYLY